MKNDEKSIVRVPEPTLRRLPKYINLLEKLKRESVQFVSSNLISEELGLDSIQVRKDLALTGIAGKPKLGFNLGELLQALYHTLNWDNSNDAFLAGAGSLGSALLGYKTFKDYGLNIIAAFDINPALIGSKINETEILPIDKLAEMINRMHVNIGVICVPADEAQQTADIMVQGGIKAIWNFAPVHLKVPAGIIVENAQLSQSLGVLTHKLAERLKPNTK